MSNIRCVTVHDAEGNVHSTLSMPHTVIERMNAWEDEFGEQEGAKRRDRLLSALAAMVIQSIDAFRTSEIRGTPVVLSAEQPHEGTSNGDSTD